MIAAVRVGSGLHPLVGDDAEVPCAVHRRWFVIRSRQELLMRPCAATPLLRTGQIQQEHDGDSTIVSID
jgi:hypothetical protein